MLLENVGVGTELSKRFYLDGVVLSKPCECGKIMELDLSNTCLDYPVVGKPEVVCFYCETCDIEYESTVTINISLDVKY